MSKKRSRCRSKSCVAARKRLRKHHPSKQLSKDSRPSPPLPKRQRVKSLFEEYFEAQNWLRKHEHSLFLSTLRQPLPVCFRIRSTSTGTTVTASKTDTTKSEEKNNKSESKHSLSCRAKQEDTESDLQRLLQQERLPRPQRLPGDAWQLSNPNNYSSSSLSSTSRTTNNPRIRHWLTTQQGQGGISRQEFVSMIPVFLLEIQSHHRILDLCASPGSKTLQALDALFDSWHHEHHHHRDDNYGGNHHPPRRSKYDSYPSGFVVANELDPRRAYVLAHRCKMALGERLASLAVTCHNACKFPNVMAPLQQQQQPPSASRRPSNHNPTEKMESSASLSPSSVLLNNTKRIGLLFDRIICDVPCSGDGTLRKDLKVWKTWHPSYGIALHSLQLRIAKRGIALLPVGGLMTYSTCSFHPIENEAVVAALLQSGCIEVVSCHDSGGAPTSSSSSSSFFNEQRRRGRIMQNIRHRPGLTEWKVLDDTCQEQHPHDHPDWPRTLWPPTKTSLQEHKRLSESLRRCIRMVPHDNDTGGFFIALLRKVKDFPVPPTTTKKQKRDSHSSQPQRQQNKKLPSIVTPVADHHRLYPVLIPLPPKGKEEGSSDCLYSSAKKDSPSQSEPISNCQVFTRGKQQGSQRQYHIATPLADYLTASPGSAKLNLVYSGYCP